MLTIKQAIFTAKKRISLLDAEVLLAYTLNKDKPYLIGHSSDRLPLLPFLRYGFYVLKRYKKWPIAYILGHKEFYGLEFLVNKNTLIPRPETELLVEDVLETMPTNATVLDIGTGSGCIAISIKTHKPKNEVVACDVSKKALNLAKKNATKLGVNMSFLHSDLLKNNDIKDIVETAPYLVITANLPYLTKLERKEPSIAKEPTLALVAKNNGLALYETMLEQLMTIRQDNTVVYMEINAHQKDQLMAISGKITKGKMQVIKDLSGKDRILKVSF